jgi:hypothetical protein
MVPVNMGPSCRTDRFFELTDKEIAIAGERRERWRRILTHPDSEILLLQFYWFVD